jgi:DNA-directed RNA polymerase subunit B"
MAEVSSFYDKDSTIKTEFYGRILQDIIKRDGFSANIIENYNNEMINRIPDIIKNTKFEARNGIISFENVRPQKPRDNVKGEVENLYPMNSRMKTQPYFGQIIADVIFTPKPIGKNPSGEEIYNAIPEKKSNFVLGELPVMLGSELCHLHGLTDEQRMNLGECFTRNNSRNSRKISHNRICE